ncbi:hypothetical protein AB1Y20_007633 [Prymnesium parvum]|uniref:Calnexin n=1 Tax=Prymnesium parvum TaxID=97485 RepID=A0AB34IVY3_PRYPA
MASARLPRASAYTALLLALCGAAAAADGEPAQPEKEESYTPPNTVDGAQFYEPFVDGWGERWVISKDKEFTGKWRLETYSPDSLVGDMGLVVGDAAQRHAVSTTFPALDPKGTGLVVQYELQLKNGLQCGGAYLKLLTASEELSLEGFHASTPYTIMFGPDKCGETNKVHFILRHKSPVTGEWEEKHLTTPPVPDTNDKQTHLYTAIVGTDNTVRILVDNEEKRKASLLSAVDFKPPVNPPKEVDDPEDKKPEDWVDEAKIDDPNAAKPDDWDEDAPQMIADPDDEKPAGWLDDAPLKIPDPEGKIPDDWDADEDGEWEAPLVNNPECKAVGCGEWRAKRIVNPEYKGKWYAPKIDNPEYKGVWKPKQIPNPNYFEDTEPHAMAPIGGIGIELWTMQNGILFDNILVSTDPSVAAELAKGTFVRRKAIEKTKKPRDVPKGEGVLGKFTEYATKALYFAQDNPLPIALALCLGLLPLLLYCCWPSRSALDELPLPDEGEEQQDEGGEGAEDEQAVEDITDKAEEDKAEDKAEEDKKEEKASTPKSGARKRTPKAS